MQPDVEVALIGALSGLVPAAITVVVGLVQKRSAKSRRLEALDSAQRRVAFLKEWFSLRALTGPAREVSGIRKRLAHDLDTLRVQVDAATAGDDENQRLRAATARAAENRRLGSRQPDTILSRLQIRILMANRSDVSASTKSLMATVGFVAIALPVVLTLASLAAGEIRPSIWDYESTNLRSILVAGLVAIGIPLLLYRGYSIVDAVCRPTSLGSFARTASRTQQSPLRSSRSVLPGS